MQLTKNPVFLHYFSKFMGILIFVLKYMYISLLLKMINGFSWPAKIMVSPFKVNFLSLLENEHFICICSLRIKRKGSFLQHQKLIIYNMKLLCVASRHTLQEYISSIFSKVRHRRRNKDLERRTFQEARRIWEDHS